MPVTGNRLLVKILRRFLLEASEVPAALNGLGPNKDRELLTFRRIGRKVRGQTGWARRILLDGIILLMDQWNEFHGGSQLQTLN